MRTIQTACILAAGLACAVLPASAEEHRQLGAHVHGHGRLNIAIEGKKLSIELEVPGADIVGFEHEPSTPEQRAAIPEAKAKLANALALFGPEPKAGCELDSVKISVEAGHHEDEHEHEHEHEAHDGAAGHEDHEDEAGHQHSEFHAEYTLTCSSPSRLTSMTFDYFNAFAGAQELDVTVIAPKGQSSFEVKRDKPSLDLTGIM
ncbi:MAG: DUF2796 domain-containing protein [Rhodomicrobium sp.]